MAHTAHVNKKPACSSLTPTPSTKITAAAAALNQATALVALLLLVRLHLLMILLLLLSSVVAGGGRAKGGRRRRVAACLRPAPPWLVAAECLVFVCLFVCGARWWRQEVGRVSKESNRTTDSTHTAQNNNALSSGSLSCSQASSTMSSSSGSLICA